jgi:DNA-binding transcriptional LysR family regulator
LRLDLNLVSVLEAIMLEGNVTRAAASLGMSQPAVSNALRRARRLTGDELFLRVADGVRPTSRMIAMWPELHRSLATIRTSISSHRFDVASNANTFRLAITDSIATEAVCSVTLDLRAASPFARVVFALHTNADSIEGIERGTLDCAIGMFPTLPRSLNVQGLFTDKYVCVMRKGHKLSRRMSLDDFVESPHVLVTPSGQDLGVVDGWLSLQGRRRNVVAVVNHFADAIKIVAESDLMTCVPSRFFDRHHEVLVAPNCLVARDLPFEAQNILYKLIWHERAHAHPAHQWFRTLVADACRSQSKSGGSAATGRGKKRSGSLAKRQEADG